MGAAVAEVPKVTEEDVSGHPSSLHQSQGARDQPAQLLSVPVFPVPPFVGPVGSRLHHFWKNWQAMGADGWVVRVLRCGYTLPFGVDHPPLTTVPSFQDTYRVGSERHTALLQQVTALLQKQAIELVSVPGPSFYSRLFVTPKRSGEWRPIIDLSRLNKFLVVPHFKMETQHSIVAAMKIGAWSTSLDLQDAFLHVPIAEQDRKYLRFCIGQNTYQFRSMPFGLATAPLVFTRVAKVVASYVHSQGLPLLQFLDDWNSLSPSFQASQCNTDRLLQLTTGLGFLVNYKKSDLIPSQQFEFVGVHFDLVQARAWPAPHRRQAFLSVVQAFRADPQPSAHQWQILLGHLTSLQQLVPRGRLYMRPLQYCLQRQWRQVSDPPTLRVTPDAEALGCLQWWTSPPNLDAGISLLPLPTPLRLFTDASMQGWGAHLHDHRAQGLWSPSPQHINNLELRAVYLALQQFLPHVLGQHVIAMTDNTTVVAHINNQGGTHSRSLFQLTRELLEWTDRHAITLSARHIPGRLNVLADLLSRQDQILHTEWSLHPAVARQLWRVWGQPHLDLFATSMNNKLPVYVSPLPDPNAWEEDALSLNWTNLWVYAFPPSPLLREVLDKVSREPCEMILVAPLWPTSEWFPDLLQLIVDHPRALPLRPDLLRQPVSRKTHGSLEALRLHGWRLSSNPSARADFRRQCRRVSSSHTGRAHGPAMTTGGTSSLIGVLNGVQILSLPLPPS